MDARGWRKSFGVLEDGGSIIHDIRGVATFCLAFIRLSESEQKEKRAKEERVRQREQ